MVKIFCVVTSALGCFSVKVVDLLVVASVQIVDLLVVVRALII